MKKLLSIFMVCTILFCLTACSSNRTSSVESPPASDAQTAAPAEESEQPTQPSEQELESSNSDSKEAGTNTLVVYFSATGNTKAVAEKLAEMQDADLYEIVPEEPYSDEDLNYNDRSTRATAEQNDENARPTISGSIDNIDDYDVIYIGYPIWWGDMPRILYTFIDTYDLSGKIIAPFCTSGGSGLLGTAGTIAAMEPDATVLEGLHISDSSVSGAESEISQWISSISQPEQGE